MYLNLEHFCLNVIANNLGRYNLIFNTTEDENLKLKFLFLQKKYSCGLLNRLCLKEDVPEIYIDLLINKYLKNLNASWLKNCSWEKIASKIAEIGCNVEKIYFSDDYLEEFCEETPWQDVICHLSNLKHFTFQNHCHDLILRNVAKFCADIEKINIINSPITIEAVKFLCKDENEKVLCTKLKELFIEGTAITNVDDVKYLLENLPSLETIDYNDLPLVLHSLHKNDLFLDKVEPYKVTALDLIHLVQTPLYVDILKVCLSLCPLLQNLTCGLINEDDLNKISNLSHLKELHIESFLDSEINVNNLLKSRGGNLTSLAIVNCAVLVSVLVDNCPRIEELILRRIHFLLEEDDDLKPVFNSLSSLTLESPDVSTSDRVISLLLLSSANFESLYLEKCDLLSSEIKESILKCCEHYLLTKISFCGSKIEKEFIEDLMWNCSFLMYLNIDGCFGRDDEKDLLEFAKVSTVEIDIGEHSDIIEPFNINDYPNGSTFYIIGDRIYKADTSSSSSEEDYYRGYY